MPKLTFDVIQASCPFQNAILDRELDLRDNKIPAIENLGATKNQYDTLDLTNNDIKKLENVPLLPRLKTLLLSNNRVHRVASGLAQFLPSLRALQLNNNALHQLGDLEPIFELAQVRYLSLVGNPVCQLKHYRAYVVHAMPNLRYLDFAKVKHKERLQAKKLFGGEKGAALHAQLSASKTAAGGTFEVGQLSSSPTAATTAGLTEEQQAQAQQQQQEISKLTPAEVAKIKEAIKSASTLDEVARLERMLRSGRLPM